MTPPTVQRWVSEPLTDGRVFVRYSNNPESGALALFPVGNHQLFFRRNGVWDYDRCVVEGAADLGRVTVDGVL